jgi:hypothetical protein
MRLVQSCWHGVVGVFEYLENLSRIYSPALQHLGFTDPSPIRICRYGVWACTAIARNFRLTKSATFSSAPRADMIGPSSIQSLV